MTLTITGTMKQILLQLRGMEAYYGGKELICTVINNEMGDKQ